MEISAAAPIPLSTRAWGQDCGGLPAGHARGPLCKLDKLARSQCTAHDCAFGLPDGCHFHNFWGNLVQNTGVADHPRIQRQFRTGEFSRPRKFAKSALVGRKGVESGRPKAQSTNPFDVSVRSWGWCQSPYMGVREGSGCPLVEMRGDFSKPPKFAKLSLGEGAERATSSGVAARVAASPRHHAAAATVSDARRVVLRSQGAQFTLLVPGGRVDATLAPGLLTGASSRLWYPADAALCNGGTALLACQEFLFALAVSTAIANVVVAEFAVNAGMATETPHNQGYPVGEHLGAPAF